MIKLMPTTQTTSNLPPVTYTRSARAKHLRITIKPTRTITVTVPRHTNQKQAQQFLLSKIAWIKKHLKKIDQYDKLQDTPDLTIDLDKAQGELFNRLDYFSDKYNLPYNRAAFRCQKTKWGSCSSKNNISLNVNIAYLTKELQDYILLHELVHTKIKNHSKQFWAELDRYLGGRAKLLQKELRVCRMRVRV
jgi:predicted metal-dependent hydrolase